MSGNMIENYGLKGCGRKQSICPGVRRTADNMCLSEHKNNLIGRNMCNWMNNSVLVSNSITTLSLG